MKWIRGLFFCLVAAIALLVVAGFVGSRMLHGRPDWYMHVAIDPGQREQIAKRVEDKLTDATNWSQSAWSARQHPSAQQPPAPLEFSLSEDEINAFISKWAELSDGDKRVAAVLTEPQVALDNGELTLAATVKELETVVSVHLTPRIDQTGLIHADIDKVMGGQLPLPQAIWDVYANKLAAHIQAELPAAQRNAKLRADGSANNQMVEAVLGRMMLHFLHGEPADPVVFLKYAAKNELGNLPVKITSLKIADKTLMLTFEPLKAGEAIQ